MSDVPSASSQSEPELTDSIDRERPAGPEGKDIQDWTDLGREMWAYLTGRAAAVNYSFIDMTVEVPRDIGPEAPRATWKLNGTLRVTTSDDQAAGSDPYRS